MKNVNARGFKLKTHIGVRCSLTILALTGLCGSGSTSRVSAAELPPAAPILRIEPGMHMGAILASSIDHSGKYLATAGEDNTIRIWSLPGGALLKTLRPPIYDLNEKIQSVAISPDGGSVVCSRRDRPQIYRFSRETGAMIQVIADPDSGSLSLAYSPDGEFLAAGRLTGGLAIYRSDGSLVAEDRAYRSDCSCLAFAAAGGKLRLATGDYDCLVRLYSFDGAGLQLLGKTTPNPKVHAASMVFSPDGSRLAFSTTAAALGITEGYVYVFSTNDLSLLAAHNQKTVFSFGLAWSPDSQALCGGGWHIFRKWADRGEAAGQDFPMKDSSIGQILTLDDQRFVFAGTSWGIVGPTGHVLFQQPSVQPYSFEPFRISHDGVSLQFIGGATFGQHAHFSLPQRQMQLTAEAYQDETGANIEGFTNPGWSARYNGQPIPGGDCYLFADVLAAQKLLLVGGNSLQLYTQQLDAKWRGSVPAFAQAVSIRDDGRLAMAALADGTIRWYRMTDGTELLDLYPTPDRTRWVLWTPSGYYDCSAGGEDLIGWHVNNGQDREADFFPASHFHSTYYRPDVVSRILSTLDESEAVRQANEARGRKNDTTRVVDQLPPVVRILSPSDDTEVMTETTTIRYWMRTPSGEPVTSIRAMVDDRPVENLRDLQEVSKVGEALKIDIRIPERDCLVSILAQNRFGSSEPASVHLKWKGSAPGGFVIKPKLYVLAVGVSQYPHPEWVLNFPAKDVHDFVEIMNQQKGLLYRDVEAKVLTDQNATKDNIEDGLDWLKQQTTSKDVAMLYLSGHGFNDSDGTYYYVPVNFDLDRTSRTGLPSSDIKRTLSGLAGKVIFFLDTCHSGNALTPGASKDLDINGAVNELVTAETGAIVFAASTGKQRAQESPEWKNGAFTHALIEGLEGQADYNHTGRITVNMLDLFISEEVKKLTDGRQTPTTIRPAAVPDFPVALVNASSGPPAAPQTAQIPLPGAGEIEVEGIIRAVDAASGTLTVEVSAVTLPGKAAMPLAAHRTKVLRVTPQSLVQHPDGSTRAVSFSDLHVGTTIIGVGKDEGVGAPLGVRVLALEG